jgi:hypothetical protein
MYTESSRINIHRNTPGIPQEATDTSSNNANNHVDFYTDLHKVRIPTEKQQT